ncbi:MAG: glycosyltransferase [Candidatus Hodarchaeales archaeon]|jgi:glycosyltransferase involved in cell wall biosynthesis
MKILHFSDEGLPDTRLDRYSHIFTNLKHETYFYGGFEQKTLHTFNSFHEITENPIPRSVHFGIPISFQFYKKKFSTYYKNLKPDVVHAHNLMCGKICLDLNIPYIYDDHEYWYYQIASRNMDPVSLFSKRKLLNSLYNRRIKQWEKKVIAHAKAVITVSDTIEKEHKEFNPNTHTIPNFPTMFEINQLPPLNQSKNILKILLLTKYASRSEKRSVDKFIELLSEMDADLSIIGNHGEKKRNINYLGYLSNKEMLEILPNFHIGLYTIQEERRQIGYFKYISPNRVFQYIHAGMTPILHEEMAYLVSLLKNNGIYINKEDDVVSIIDKLKNDSEFLMHNPKKIQEFARKEFVFDKYEKNLIDIYTS